MVLVPVSLVEVSTCTIPCSETAATIYQQWKWLSLGPLPQYSMCSHATFDITIVNTTHLSLSSLSSLKLWKTVRPVSPTLLDFFFALVYIFYQVTAHSYVISIIVTQKFAAAPSLFLSVEQVGGCMNILYMYTYTYESDLMVI